MFCLSNTLTNKCDITPMKHSSLWIITLCMLLGLVGQASSATRYTWRTAPNEHDAPLCCKGSTQECTKDYVQCGYGYAWYPTHAHANASALCYQVTNEISRRQINKVKASTCEAVLGVQFVWKDQGDHGLAIACLKMTRGLRPLIIAVADDEMCPNRKARPKPVTCKEGGPSEI